MILDDSNGYTIIPFVPYAVIFALKRKLNLGNDD